MFFAYILFLLSLKEISLFVKMFIDLSCNIFFAIILKQEIELNPFPKFVNYIFGTDVSLMNWEITIIFPSVLWVSVCEYIDLFSNVLHSLVRDLQELCSPISY